MKVPVFLLDSIKRGCANDVLCFFVIQIEINIQPGPPLALIATESPGMPTVSNTKSMATRTIIRSLQLQLIVSHTGCLLICLFVLVCVWILFGERCE